MNYQVLYEAEAFVLGSIILEPDLIFECYLQQDEFVDDRHRLIMKYFRFLSDHDKPIDPMIMAETSGENLYKIGGMEYLTQLAGSVPTTANFVHYQSIVRKAYIKRRASRTLRDLADYGESADVDAKEYAGTIHAAAEDILDLTESEQRDVVKMSDVLIGHEKVLMKRSEQRGITGAKTASAELDRLTGGHQDGDLEVIAARPSMGKTAYVVNDIVETARGGRTAVLFSLEMDAKKIAERAIGMIGNIDGAKLRTGALGDLEWERWSNAIDELERLPIYIDDTPGMTLQQIGAKVKRLKKKHPRMVAYIDYLQLVNPGRKFNKEHEGVAYVSKGLKQIARRNECPVIAISAVGRQCEQRQDKRPLMSDLRESGSIESDADIIIFLFRDDYYNSESSKKGIVELIIAKGRNVGTGTVEMVFNMKTGRYTNIYLSQKGAAGGERKTDRK